jgi:hypothetical protein
MVMVWEAAAESSLRTMLTPRSPGVERVGVEGGGAFAQVFDGFAHGGVGEVDAGDDDVVELAVDGLGAAGGEHGLLEHSGGAEIGAADGGLPAFVHVRDHAGACFVVSGIGHAHAGEIDLLHAAAGGDVVAVEAEDGLVFFRRHRQSGRCHRGLGRRGGVF